MRVDGKVCEVPLRFLCGQFQYSLLSQSLSNHAASAILRDRAMPSGYPESLRMIELNLVLAPDDGLQ